MKTYAVLIETHNNHWPDIDNTEWRFYIPREGNKEALKELEQKIQSMSSYNILDISATEEQVDRAVKKNRNPGPVKEHNKLEGRLSFHKSQPAICDNSDVFGGGVIRRYMYL